MSEKEHEFTPEEITAAQKDRTVMGAALIEGGAEYVMDEGAKEPRLEVTDAQREGIQLYHLKDVASEKAAEAAKAQEDYLRAKYEDLLRPFKIGQGVVVFWLKEKDQIEGSYVGTKLVGEDLNLLIGAGYQTKNVTHSIPLSEVTLLRLSGFQPKK